MACSKNIYKPNHTDHFCNNCKHEVTGDVNFGGICHNCLGHVDLPEIECNWEAAETE